MMILLERSSFEFLARYSAYYLLENIRHFALGSGRMLGPVFMTHLYDGHFIE